MVDLVLIPVFVLVLVSFRSQTTDRDYLSIEKCNCLRGMLAIFIVLHHMSEKINNGLVFYQFQHLGYLIVAVFFFLSGYGLMLSYKKKGVSYFNDYWKKRIGYLAVVYFLVSILYFVYFNIVGRTITIGGFIRSFVNGNPTAMFSWYIIVQLLFYVIFWIVFKLFDKKNNRIKIVITLFLTIIMMTAFYCAGYDSYWYLSDIAFVVGLIYAENRDRIDKLLSKNALTYLLILGCYFAFFAIFSLIPSLVSKIGFDSNLIYDVCRNISSALFSLVIVTVLFKVDIKSKMWGFLGGISLEIYLLQGIPISFLQNRISNDALWIILVVVITVILAILAGCINKKLSLLFKGRKDG